MVPNTPVWLFEFRELLGVLLSLTAAMFAASVNLSVRIASDRGRVYDTVIIVMCINVVVLAPLVLAVYYPDYGLTYRSFGWFVGAGVLGTICGRLFRYTSIDIIGASRTTPIVASWALVATVLGVVFLDETMTVMHIAGVVLIVGGVVAIAFETSQENPIDLSRRDLLLGLTFPFAAALALGVEPILVNFGFREGTPAPVGLLVRTATGLVGFTAYLWMRDALPTPSVLSSASMRWYVYAGITSTLAILAYYVALEVAPVSIVTPIFVTNTLFVVVLSALVMPDRLEVISWKLLVAATVVVTGVVLVTVYG